MRRTLVVTVTVLLSAGGALAGLVDSGGEAIGWGVTPFTQPNQASTYDDGLELWMTIQNDYAPIDYPGGVGYRPSPSGSTGEGFDLEEMYVRPAQSQVQVLLIASNYPSVDAVGSTWRLGDLMITVDDQEFGIVTSDANQGLDAGAVYRIDTAGDVVGLQDQSRSYFGDTRLRANDYGPDATISDIVGALAVSGTIDVGQRLGTADLQTDVFDYGGAEDGTYLLQYTFESSLLGLDAPPQEWITQMTWGCGNDVIRVRGDDTHPIPEPATFAMLLLGVGMTWWARRRSEHK